MPTITIPKELSRREEFIAVPRNTYKEFLEWQKKIKSAKTFKPTEADKKTLAEARRNFPRGEYITLEELKRELDLDN